MICTKCLSRSIYPVWRKRRNVKSIYGDYHYMVDVVKCLDCGKYAQSESEQAPYGSRWDWATIRYVLNDQRGHQEPSRAIMREFGIYLSKSTICDMRAMR